MHPADHAAQMCFTEICQAAQRGHIGLANLVAVGDQEGVPLCQIGDGWGGNVPAVPRNQVFQPCGGWATQPLAINLD